jgi:hypothetical protein
LCFFLVFEQTYEPFLPYLTLGAIELVVSIYGKPTENAMKPGRR